jgi:hypothetical protein
MYRAGRLVMICILLATLFFAGPAGISPRVAAAPAATIRLRIGVTTDGIVQLTPADLVAAGVDPASVDPNTFAMSSMGQPVAIQVTANEDSSFDQGERVLFFGQKFRGTQFEEKYTDERVYWLDIGGAAGLRFADPVDATPRGDLTPPPDVATTVHAEADTLWFQLGTTALVNVTQDNWFWSELKPTPQQPVTASVGYTVPDPAPGSAAMFRLTEFANYSNANVSAQPEHRTVVTLNGASLLDQTWTGRWVHELSTTVPADRLVNGLNSVEVSSHVMPYYTNGIPLNYTDDVFVNNWELDYRRLFRAWQGQFDFYAEGSGPQEYVVDNWAGKWVAIWDVSNADQPRSLAGAEAKSGGPSAVQLRFRTNDGVGARYWLQDESAFQRPTTIRIRPNTGLRNPARGADTVIVTPTEFRPAAERLAMWHEAHGRRTVIVDLQDVYDEFNAGIAIAPQAIPNLLAWVSKNWQSPAPAYLTLIGDGHYNIKGHNPEIYGTVPSWIPPYLVFADPWLGEVAADMRYGDINGDGLPEVAVGRVTANTPAEAIVVVDKIVHYDETSRTAAWQHEALFVADNPDSAGDFRTLSDNIIADYLPTDLTVTRAYLPDSPATADEVAATKKVISDALQSGVWLVQYTGHGNTFLWAEEKLLQTQDIAGFKNGDRLPISMVFDCKDGNFFYPQSGRQSVAELMQRQEGGGAVAAISPSGDGITPDQQTFRKILMTIMFQENVREIGKALDEAKRRYAAQDGARYLIETMTLFGDPAMRLPISARHVYLPAVLR